MASKVYQIPPAQNISQLISSLFESAGDNIDPVNIPNSILASKEVTNLITNFKESKDWDEQLSVVQHAIAFVKGNACNYFDFTSQLPQLISQITTCIKSARTTLAKYSCLLISLLAKTLKDHFDNLTDIVFTSLFQMSSSGTQIVSSSCKYAIFSIVHNVPTKKVILSTLKQCSSSSQIEKIIASESINFIVNEWNRNSLFPYLKQIEKSIYDLLSDSNSDIKNNAKLSAVQLMKLYPDRNSVLYPIVNSSDLNIDTNTSKDNDVLSKKASSYSKDYSNTISFSYIPQVQPNQKKQDKDLKVNDASNSKSTKIKTDSNDKNYISNIPRKKRSAYSSYDYQLPGQNSFDEAQTMTFTFEPESLSSQSSISEIQKLTDEAQTISFSFDPITKGPSSFYSKERSKQNSNLSVRFIRPNSSNSNIANKDEKGTGNKFDSISTSFNLTNKEEPKVNQVSQIQNDTNFQDKDNNNSKAIKDVTSSYLPDRDNQKFSNLTEDSKDSMQINKNAANTYLSNIENQSPGTRIEVSSPNYFSTSLISFQLNKFECNSDKESQENFLDSIRTTIATKQTIFIRDNADSISSGFLICLQSPNDSIQISALNLLVDVIKIIPNSFENDLELLIKIMLEKADKANPKTSMNATTALRAISSQFPAEKLILITAQCTETDSLLSFIANLVRNDETILNNDQIASTLLPICCKVYETTKEQRFSALSVGLLNKISEKNPKIFSIFANSVDEQWFKLLKSLYLEPKGSSNSNNVDNNENGRNGPTRILSSMVKYTKKNNSPESRLDDLLRQLNVEKIKFTILNNLINFFKETNGEVFESAIPQLVNLIHSSYHEQVKECIKAIASTEGGVAFSSFLDSVVDYVITDTTFKSIDFLSNVVKYYKSRDLSPRVQQILEKVKPYLEDSYAPARKAAIFLIVELRLAIGKAFDGEINKLSNVSKKMVLFYISKKQSNC